MIRATLLTAAIMAVGMAGVWPDTARSAPVSECKSGTDHCLYPDEELSLSLSTINNAGASCTVSFTVRWGDGAADTVTVSPMSQRSLSHEYAKPGRYTITKEATVISPSEQLCDLFGWGAGERSAEVLPPILRITELTLNDIDNKPLKFLSTDDHAYFNGNTRIHGTITVKGRPKHELESLKLEVRGEDGTLATATLDVGVKNALLTKFGRDEKVAVGKSKLLFVLPSAQADLLDSQQNGEVELKVVARTRPTIQLGSLKAARVFGSVPRLVRYTDANRYGERDADKGGDDWVKPGVRPVAEHFAGITWGDFSNMNGGNFPPHDSHRTGNDIDGTFGGYAARDAATAQTIIGHLNDNTYGSRIERVLVTFNAPGTTPLACEGGVRDTDHRAFWNAIQGVTLNDGRSATNVIRPVKGHCNHFHWKVTDQ